MNEESKSQPQMVLLFDGVCNLCSGMVQFIIPRDRKGLIHFAPLQSAAGQRLLQQYLEAANDFQSVVFIDHGKVYTKSAAIARVLRKLDGCWPALGILAVFPAPFRDFLYDWVARNRYLWFGKKEQCLIPTPEHSARFLE